MLKCIILNVIEQDPFFEHFIEKRVLFYLQSLYSCFLIIVEIQKNYGNMKSQAYGAPLPAKVTIKGGIM